MSLNPDLQLSDGVERTARLGRMENVMGGWGAEGKGDGSMDDVAWGETGYEEPSLAICCSACFSGFLGGP